MRSILSTISIVSILSFALSFSVLSQTISIPDTTADYDSEIQLPIRTSNITGLEIYSFYLEISYDQRVIDALSIATENSLAKNFELFVFKDSLGLIKAGFAGSGSLAGDGDLLFINFKVVGNIGDSTVVHVDYVEFGETELTGNALDGKVRITPTLLTAQIPDAAAATYSSVKIPILIGDISDYNIYSLGLVLSYDQHVLKLNTMTTDSALTDAWGNAYFNEGDSLTYISLAGTSSLVGSGVLLYLTFDVIGSLWDSTYIQITAIEFNDFVPEIILDSGLFRVNFEPPAEVIVTIPEMTTPKDTIITVPIFVSEVTGLGIDSVYLALAYDTKILTAIGARIAGTLVSLWPSPEFKTEQDRIYLTLAGSIPLSGSGALINIDFAAIGDYNTFSPISVDSVYIDNQRPQLVTKNGKVTINGPVRLEQLTAEQKIWFQLYPNYPNPFNPSTTISFQLANAGHVRITIYNAAGAQVKNLINADFDSGTHAANWDGKNDSGNLMASGIYMSRFEMITNEGKHLSQFQKLLLVK